MRRYAVFAVMSVFAAACSWILGINLAVPVILILLSLLLQSMHRAKELKNYRMLYLIFLYVIVTAATYMIRTYKAPVFFTPFCVLALLSVMLFNDLVVAFVLTVAGAVTAAAIHGNDLYMGMLFLTSGIAAALLVNGARRRNAVIQAVSDPFFERRYLQCCRSGHPAGVRDAFSHGDQHQPSGDGRF